MKAKIEKYIPAALNQIKIYYIANSNRPIKKEYKSYLSSIGASIIMSGLLPTLAVYYSQDSKADRLDVINWVFNIVKPIYDIGNHNDDLFKYAVRIKDNKELTNRLIEDVLNISIALKLSIRTFPLTK